MIKITFRPLQTWPRKRTTTRNFASFKTTYSQTLELLEKELRQLNAANVVIQLALKPADIRLDGLPRANATPEHSGVILNFDGKHGSISMPCDKFVAWQHNLRAIALTLERLRLADLYGVTQSGEQYQGWAALPPAPEVMKFKTREEAAEFIARIIKGDRDLILSNSQYRKGAGRTAMRDTHPDNGGSDTQFINVCVAIKLLEE